MLLTDVRSVWWSGHGLHLRGYPDTSRRVKVVEIFSQCGFGKSFEYESSQKRSRLKALCSICKPNKTGTANQTDKAFQSCADSQAYATRYTVSSSHHFPTICSPTGSFTSLFAAGPSFGVSMPIGNVKAGWPV